VYGFVLFFREVVGVGGGQVGVSGGVRVVGLVRTFFGRSWAGF